VQHGGCYHASVRLNPCRRGRVDQHHHSSSPPCLTSSLLSATSTTDSETSTDAMNRKGMALQLMEENSMLPLPVNDDDHPLESTSDANNHPLGHYDEDHRTPVESEFLNLMSTFLTYSERDIQSLTTTSTRYLHYQHHHDAQNNEIRHPPNANPKRPRTRSKEEGIRYRALYSGVQAASLEPEVLRSFTVLFEDYLPIRLAGRRIYGHLKNVMEEVREERVGELAVAREGCPSWDRRVDDGEDILEYARTIWDTIVDEALLQESSVVENEQSQEGGVISLSQIILFGIDRVLIQEGLVNDATELECIVRQVVLEEDVEIEKYYNRKKEPDMEQVQKDGKYLEMTFAIFMKILYQCRLRKKYHDDNYLMNMLQKVEQQVLEQQTGGFNQDTSTMLAAKAVHCGSSTTSQKRQKYSDRYDEYVSKFQLWERKFLGNADAVKRQSRRLDILRGCFVGARNAKVVAALKIVYMDYAALRLAGDLIFKLMSKIAN